MLADVDLEHMNEYARLLLRLRDEQGSNPHVERLAAIVHVLYRHIKSTEAEAAEQAPAR
jgi:hypothetical protein